MTLELENFLCFGSHAIVFYFSSCGVLLYFYVEYLATISCIQLFRIQWLQPISKYFVVDLDYTLCRHYMHVACMVILIEYFISLYFRRGSLRLIEYMNRIFIFSFRNRTSSICQCFICRIRFILQHFNWIMLFWIQFSIKPSK